jgi:hypothetical protein
VLLPMFSTARKLEQSNGDDAPGPSLASQDTR